MCKENVKDKSDTGVGFDAAVLRRERELAERWGPDWHNARRTDPPVQARVAAATSDLGIATISLSVEEIDVILDRLDGSVGCANPILCDAISILMGARAQFTRNTASPVAPAAWGVR